ncbi:hypothetical protein IGI04_030504 [Brassica rapa subsp. trilocularis]|uniref:Uncharacterized protein n=1 Tax=Brassica rapa subsp. trilocularis TaxID=1813537 RepID=A0ABQ7LTL5_BRACM|nr:hypothetical protein IGI04_030504 [Brassica rapa subsp. trilocularis]
MTSILIYKILHKELTQVVPSSPVPTRRGLSISRVQAVPSRAGCGPENAGPVPYRIISQALTSRPAGWTRKECSMTFLDAAGCSSDHYIPKCT